MEPLWWKHSCLLLINILNEVLESTGYELDDEQKESKENVERELHLKG